MSLPVYPTYPGLGFSVKWTPVFFNQSYKTVSGASIDIGLASQPLHNFELTYNFLRDIQPAIGIIETDFANMMNFFLPLAGSLGRFLFDNPDDDVKVGQYLGTGNGVNSIFPLVRSFGLSIAVLEPVGMLNINNTYNVYLNGVLQPGNSYTIITSAPGNNLVIFNNPPGNGVVVRIDFSYYYYCKFTDDSMGFEKFLNKIWAVQKVSFQSCRAGA